MERSRNLIIIGFAVLMAVSLVIFYAPGRNSQALSTTGTEVLARVGSDKVTVADLNSLKESKLREIQAYGQQFNLAQLGMTDTRLLDQLIQQRIVVQEAQRLGLSPYDKDVPYDPELRAYLLKQKEFRDEAGKFIGLDKYKERIIASYGDVERFERGIRDQLASQKLFAFITAGVHVSDEEVQKDYQRQNIKFDLVYVAVTPDKLAEKIQPTDEDARAYFQLHQTNYRIFEPQKKIRYLFIDQAKMGEKLNISDADLHTEYDQLKPEAKEAGNRVQQIVLKVAQPSLDAAVKAKAEGLATQARGQTGTATEKDFADLAKGQSEDPATAKNGGTLPNFVKKDAAKPNDPLQRIFETEVGGISGPIKNGNAYYIYRRGDSVPKTFEQAKTEILASLRNRRAYAAAAELAARATERLKQDKDFEKVAKEFAAEANMNPANMVKETAYIVPGDDVPDIGSNQQFEQALEPLNNPQDVGAQTPIKNGFAIPMLLDKKEARLPDYDEVKEKVFKDVKLDRAKLQLEETARNLANSTNGAADLKAAAAKLGLEAKDEGAYKLGMELGTTATNPGADETIYGLKEGEITKTPVKIGDVWFVIGASKRTEADLTEFNKNRDRLVEQATSTRRGQVFGDYITSVKTRMEGEGRISIDQDVLKQFEGEAPEMANPALPRRAPRNIPAG